MITWREIIPIVLILLGVILVVFCIKIYTMNKPEVFEENYETRMKLWREGIFYRAIMAAMCFVFGILAVMASQIYYDNLEIYNEGILYEENGDWNNAYDVYMSIYNRMGEWKDIKDHIYYVYPRYQYEEGLKAIDENNWLYAFTCFDEATDYLNSEILAEYCYFKYLQEVHSDWSTDTPVPYLF